MLELLDYLGKLSDETKNIARIVLAGIFFVLFIISCIMFATGKYASIDSSAATMFSELKDDALITVAKAITFCANWYTIVVLSIILLLLPNRMELGVPVIIATVVGTGIQSLLKIIVQRPRPLDAEMFISASGYSFPSGHATSGLIFYLFLMILLSRMLIIDGNKLAANLLRFLMIVFVFFIGLSRIILCVHFFSDVYAGWMLGATLLTISVFLYETIWPNQLKISYSAPEWRAIPKDFDKTKKWKKPVNKKEETALLEFPKHRSGWKYPKIIQKEEPEEWVYLGEDSTYGSKDQKEEPEIPMKAGRKTEVEEYYINENLREEKRIIERSDGYEENERSEEITNPIAKIIDKIEKFFSKIREKILSITKGKPLEKIVEHGIEKALDTVTEKFKEIIEGIKTKRR